MEGGVHALACFGLGRGLLSWYGKGEEGKLSIDTEDKKKLWRLTL